MTGLGKDWDEVGAMSFGDISKIVKFWRTNPPAHILLGIIAQEKVWKPRQVGDQMIDASIMALVGRNRYPLQKLPADVAQAFAAVRSGKMPGLEPVHDN